MQIGAVWEDSFVPVLTVLGYVKHHVQLVGRGLDDSDNEAVDGADSNHALDWSARVEIDDLFRVEEVLGLNKAELVRVQYAGESRFRRRLYAHDFLDRRIFKARAG